MSVYQFVCLLYGLQTCEKRDLVSCICACCLPVCMGAGVWRSKEEGMMEEVLAWWSVLWIWLQSEKCTEIELLGKLPGKSLFQCRNSALIASPILGGGSGWLGSLHRDLPILLSFLYIDPHSLSSGPCFATPWWPSWTKHVSWLPVVHSASFHCGHGSFPQGQILPVFYSRIQCSLPGPTWHPRLSTLSVTSLSLQTPRGPSLTTCCLVPPKSSLPTGEYLLLHNPD